MVLPTSPDEHLLVVHRDPQVAARLGGGAAHEQGIDAAIVRLRDALRRDRPFGVVVMDLSPVPPPDVGWLIDSLLALHPDLQVVTVGGRAHLGPHASHPRVTRAIAEAGPLGDGYDGLRAAIRRAFQRRQLRRLTGPRPHDAEPPAPPRTPSGRQPISPPASAAQRHTHAPLDADGRGLLSAFLRLLHSQLDPPLRRLAEQLEGHASGEVETSLILMARDARALYDRLVTVQELCQVDLGYDDIEHTRFSLPALVARVLGELAPLAAREARELVIAGLPEHETHFLGAEPQIGRILRALVDNALTHAEGPVRVLARPRDRNDGRVMVRFEVEDSGPGIAPEEVPRVFERHVRLSPERGDGMGLGLAVAKELTELLGGRIGAMSAPGMGSTFWFEVPLRRAPPPRAAAPERLPVLVVEDDAINRMVVTRILEREGYTVEQATDGPEAIDKVSRGRYAVVLMDVRLPTMDGMDATQQIRAAEAAGGWHHEIVALTAHALPEYHQRCLDAGMDGYMTKPVRKAQLISLVAAAQRRAASRRES